MRVAHQRLRTVMQNPLTRQKGFDAEAFYNALARVVKARKVPWRQVARETGVTASTLTRMAQGRRPDAASLAVLSAWAGINPADFVKGSTRQQNRDAMVAISALLRADPDLPLDEAKALEQIIRLAYSRFKQRRP